MKIFESTVYYPPEIIYHRKDTTKQNDLAKYQCASVYWPLQCVV